MVESRRHLDGGLWGISIPLPIEHRACADNSHGAELRGRVQVLCVEPGYIATNLGANSLGGAGAKIPGADNKHYAKNGMPPGS